MDTYEKKYKEALEKIKNLIDKDHNDINVDDVLNIFPELVESEDEKISKEIIYFLSGNTLQFGEDIDKYKSWIAWLEKQGNKPQGKSALEAINEEKVDNHNCAKTADTVNPKFKVGDWVVFNNKHRSIYQVEKIKDGYYILRHTHGGTFRVCVLHDESLRFWTIKDAKPGDIIYLPNGNNEYYFFIFKGIENANAAVMSFVYFYQYNDGTSKVEETIDRLFSVNDVFQPATKEQRSILFQKMKEAGYEWDAEKKELKKIEQKSQRMISAEAKEAMYDKPAWSEEDEEFLRRAINATKDAYPITANWLKSIKQRIGG